MKLFLLPTLFLISFSNTVFSQNDKLIGRWTNGFDSYGSNSYIDSTIIFNGGNLHEGGAVFTVKIVNDHKFIISGREPNDNRQPMPK